MDTLTGIEILNRLTKIETLIKTKETSPLNFVEACVYLSMSHSYLYKLTAKKLIPCHKPCGKYLYFYRQELDGWIKSKKRRKKRNREVSMKAA